MTVSQAPFAEHSTIGAVEVALSQRFRNLLVRFFERRIGRRAEIEDLVQDVFLRIAAGRQAATIENPEAYLFKTAANLLHDRRRRLAARHSEAHEPYDEEAHGGARQTHGPERVVLDKQSIEQLIVALHELPERTRVVFTLHHFEDLSHKQIAQRLGIAVSTIEKHMGRACAHLFLRIDR